jgi:hypothetical protein
MVPNPIMDDAIRRAAREFCKQSRLITEEVSLTTVATVRDYTPSLAAGTELLTLSRVRRSATDVLIPTTVDDIASMTVSSELSRFYAVVETFPRTVRLYPTPSSVESLTCTFVVMPTITAVVVDDKLADWFLDGVVAYAKYWLLTQVGTPWANPDAAEFAYNQFETKVSEAVINKGAAMVDLPVRVQIRPFA